MVAASLSSESSGSKEHLERGEDGAFSLENILGDDHESLKHPGVLDGPALGWDEESQEEPAPEGFCVECEGHSEL